MKTPTDEQLKQTLAKMLPSELIFIHDAEIYEHDLMWRKDEGNKPVLDTELLHLCWLVEETINNSLDADKYIRELLYICRNLITREDSFVINTWTTFSLSHATWQQRVIALAKVKGIDIV